MKDDNGTPGMVPDVKARMKSLRGWFVTGLIVLGPLVVTVWIIYQFFIFADSVLGRPIQWTLGKVLGIQFFIDHTIRGMGFVALIILILAVGWFARQYLGSRIVSWVNRGIEKIPLVNKVYVAVLQISEALLGGRREVFKQAVLVEYPRKGLWCIGFLTQDTRGPVQTALNDDVISVFLPTTPNPTSGYLLFVPKDQVALLDVSVEEALKLIISAGAVVPLSGGSAEEVSRMMGIPYKPSSASDPAG